MKLLIAALAALQAGPTPLDRKTYTYKEASGVRIELDVYRAEGDEVRPAVVWIHGGALVTGSRADVPRHLLDLCAAEKYALVSIDYRLAPQVKLPEILEDVKDAFRWIRGPGAERARLNPKKGVVAGGSAGGYLTLMTGVAVEPRPTALVAYWGYGDVDGEWLVKPSAHYRETKPLYSREEALRGMPDTVVTGPPDKAANDARRLYYHYLRQNGLWTREITGFDPEKERSKLDPYCPARNVTAAYPPTLFVHGTGDADVPYDLSSAMAKELERCGVRHALVPVPGAGHALAKADPKLASEAFAKAQAFIRESLK